MKSISIFLVLALFGCSEPSNTQLRYKFNNPKANELLIKKLKEEDIRFNVDNEGWIQYDIVNQYKVDRIVKQVTKEFFVPETSISYTNPDITDIFVKKLEEEGIKYELREQEDRLWVIWDKEDDAKVSNIKKEIEIIILER